MTIYDVDLADDLKGPAKVCRINCVFAHFYLFFVAVDFCKNCFCEILSGIFLCGMKIPWKCLGFLFVTKYNLLQIVALRNKYTMYFIFSTGHGVCST